MNSRERFEAWVSQQAVTTVGGINPWTAWQAAEAQAVRRCTQIVGSANNYDNPMTAGDCVAAIRAEFPEAWK